jgi:hypothetical protein
MDSRKLLGHDERIQDFFIEAGFKIGRVDNTLFTKIINNEFFICQNYVDDIIFGSTNLKVCKDFSDLMSREFEMSMIRELNFFLGFQIKQLKEGTFIHKRSTLMMIVSRSRLQCLPMDIST